MQERNPILRSALFFLAIYVLLIIPWPGWNDAFGTLFRSWARPIFGREEPQRVVRFEAYRADPKMPNATRIVIANPQLARPDGNVPALLLSLDTRGVCYIPAALLFALILASPLHWKRKIVSFLIGFFLLQCYFAAIIALYIAAQNSSSPPTAASHSPGLLEKLNYLTLNQIGLSFTVPVVIWVIVTFRKGDLESLRRTLTAAPNSAR